MKKTLSIALIAMLTLILCATAVYATTSFNVALSATSTKVQRTGEVEVTISLKNFTAGETGINSLYLVLDYDKTVFQTLAATNMTASNGWSSPTFNPANGAIVIDNSSFMAEDHDALKIKFTVKDDAALGNTDIVVKNIEASDAVNDITPSDQKITLTIQEKTAPTPTPTPTPTNAPTNAPTPTPTTAAPAPSNPETGVEDFTVPALIAVSVLAIVAYVRYTRLEK